MKKQNLIELYLAAKSGNKSAQKTLIEKLTEAKNKKPPTQELLKTLKLVQPLLDTWRNFLRNRFPYTSKEVKEISAIIFQAIREGRQLPPGSASVVIELNTFAEILQAIEIHDFLRDATNFKSGCLPLNNQGGEK